MDFVEAASGWIALLKLTEMTEDCKRLADTSCQSAERSRSRSAVCAT